MSPSAGPKAPRIITIYLHGQGGSRKQGVDDFTFGGNFNRIKNLMAANGGLYLSPDFSDFGDKGAAEIAALIAPLCRKVAGREDLRRLRLDGRRICAGSLPPTRRVAAALSGLLLLGSLWDDGFLAQRRPSSARCRSSSARAAATRCSRSRSRRRSSARSRAKSAGYPARFVRFETGTHGTPIRMTDWRETLNWMLSARVAAASRRRVVVEHRLAD